MIKPLSELLFNDTYCITAEGVADSKSLCHAFQWWTLYFTMLGKVLQKLVNNRIVDHLARYVTRMSMSTVSFLAQLDSGILC